MRVAHTGIDDEPKLAAVFICSLVKENSKVAENFCHQVGFEPVYSESDGIARICINGIPKPYREILSKRKTQNLENPLSIMHEQIN